MKTYTLTVSESQAEVMSAAMEVFARLGIGQFRDALERLPLREGCMSNWGDAMDSIGEVLRDFTKNGVDGYRSSLSMTSQETSEVSKIAFDLHQVIRHRLAWERAVDLKYVDSLDSPRDWQKMVCVDYDVPLQVGLEAPATIQSVEVS